MAIVENKNPGVRTLRLRQEEGCQNGFTGAGFPQDERVTRRRLTLARSAAMKAEPIGRPMRSRKNGYGRFPRKHIASFSERRPMKGRVVGKMNQTV